MTTLGGLIVIGGGYYQLAKSVEYYVAAANVWIKAFEIDTDNRSEFKSILYEDELVLVSGDQSGHAVPTVTSYNFFTGETTIMPPLTKGGRNVGLAVVARHLYVIGGVDSEAFDRVERYSPFTKNWETVTPMPTPRHNFGVAVLNCEIYVIGGLLDTNTRISEVIVYNPVTGIWRKCAPINGIRHGHAAVAHGQYIYIFGGDNGDELLNTTERYDPKTDTWTFVKSSNFRRSWIDADILNDRQIVVAGSSNPTDEVESYDPETDKWTIIAPLAEKRDVINVVHVPWSPIKRSDGENPKK